MQHTQETFKRGTQELTPRQDRIERAIINALRSGAPRSELRDHVRHLAQLLRMQGHPSEGASGLVRALGQRAAPLMPTHASPAAGDAPEDRIGMMLKWCAAEYSRSD